MRRASYSLLWATLLASVVLGPAGGALAASGTTTSAGDQQYLDPLAATTTSSTPPAAPAPSPPASAPAASPATSAAAPGQSAGHDPSERTLPYTGFNLWLLVWVGLGLIAAGLVLRRLTRGSAGRDAP